MIKLGHVSKMPKTVSGTHLVFNSSGYCQFEVVRSRVNVELKMLVDYIRLR